MGPADVLSRKDKVETSDDNWEIILLKGKDQYFHIHAINCALTDKISSSSASDPIVTKVLRLARVGTNVDSKGLFGVSDEHIGRVQVQLVDVFLEATPARRCSERSCASKD